MSSDVDVRGSDAVATLRWAARRYAWLFLLCVYLLAIVLPALAVQRQSETYDAEALIVAQELNVNLVVLPRFADAVFESGAVETAVVQRLGQEQAGPEVIPLKVSLVEEQDSIVLRVVGHDPAPDVAAALANTAAAAFVEQLNAAGVGVFTLQGEVMPPAQPTSGLPSLSLLIPVGLLAGTALGLATVGLVVISRRPVLQPADAERATGVPVLGSVTLPARRRSSPASQEDMVGLGPLCRRVLSLDADTVVLVSAPGAARARQQLSTAIAGVLSRVCDVRLLVPGGREPLPALVPREATAAGVREVPLGPREAVPAASRLRGGLTLVDAKDALDVVLTAPSVATLLVFAEGTPLATLQVAVGEQLGGVTSGLILARRASRRIRSRRPYRRGTHRSVPSGPGGHDSGDASRDTAGDVHGQGSAVSSERSSSL